MQCLRDTIPIMQLLQELKDQGFHQANVTPVVHCKAFEDNTGALEPSLVHKMRPRTKHINNVYHHFRQFVRNKLISVTKISTEDQVADIFTKPLSLNLFVKTPKSSSQILSEMYRFLFSKCRENSFLFPKVQRKLIWNLLSDTSVRECDNAHE